MRPSRMIVGEVRQQEALDLLISLNSGTPGYVNAQHGLMARYWCSAFSSGPAGLALGTIVVFAGDNGNEELLLNRGTAGFFEGSYFTGMEAALPTPCIARWSGKVATGRAATRSSTSPTGSQP
jgi:hypothetical protein